MKLTILEGNVFNILPKIQSESIDLVLTSPPYWGLRDYGMEGQLGNEPTMEAYLDNSMRWIKEIWRVLKPTGNFVLNIGDCWYGSGIKMHDTDSKSCIIPGIMRGKAEAERGKNQKELLGKGIYKARQFLSISSFIYCRIISETDFVCRGEHIWAKPNVPSPIRSRLKHSHEKLFWFVKDVDKYFFDKKPWMKKNSAISRHRMAKDSFNNSLSRLRENARTEKDSPHSDNIGLSESSCFRLGKGEDYLSNEETIEHSWRIIPSGEKQKGFEMEDSKPKSEHVAPFPMRLIKPYIKSMCPEKVCSICGKPPSFVYENTGERTEEERKALEKLVEEKGIPRQTLGLKIKSSGHRILKEIKYCDCWNPEAGIVLDTFLGSGTTMRVAMENRRNTIGIELNTRYVAYAKKRLNWGMGLGDIEYRENLE